MQVAALVLASAALAAPGTVPDTGSGPAVSPSGDPVPVVLSQPRSQSSRSRRNARRFGVGGGVTAGTGGVGANLRYWMNDRLGITLQASWNRPSNNFGRRSVGQNPGGSQRSTLLVAPSFQYMLRPYDTTADINLRPYVGAGMNYARTSVPVGSTLQQAQDGRGFGGQVFGGVELTFADAEMIGINAEIVHYRVPESFFNAAAVNGTQFVGAIYFYF